MLDDKRLQEIKEDVANWFDTDEYNHTVIEELIAALDASQQQLAEARETIKFRAWRDDKGSDYVSNADLRAQLAEAEETIRMAYSDLPDKKYDAEATLENYMTRHNLEEW